MGSRPGSMVEKSCLKTKALENSLEGLGWGVLFVQDSGAKHLYIRVPFLLYPNDQCSLGRLTYLPTPSLALLVQTFSRFLISSG